ncbi:hypothetical protein M4D51_02905 [Microbacterium sp. p3-SID338]|uniref:hypothetical protein n=1 Tax=Microbacterium sp. p3-SID338 TaxID=2916214 RepID=UPI0021A8FDA3|nr:hypothetical protein [Microbacterium sp. p3-SID338]MCT1394669.1 hypothetical protein [Microbacterium sp. p3-SID338]
MPATEDRSEIESLLEKIDDAIAARDAAAADVAVLSGLVSDRLAALGAVDADDEGNVALARRIYIHYPEVPSSAIAVLLGVPDSAVHSHLAEHRKSN